MSAIITDQLRILNSENFVAWIASTTNSYYAWIGLPNPADFQSDWSENPPSPKDSVLRDTSVMSSAVTVSGIQSGYYFTVFDSNVGSGLTSYEKAIGTSIVGIGTSFIDNIYKVHSAKNITGDAYGIGSTVGINTTLRRVTVSVSSTEGIGIGSGFFGRFSWGRLHDFVKDGTSAFTAINDDGVTGILTGPVIIRTRDLKESYN